MLALWALLLCSSVHDVSGYTEGFFLAAEEPYTFVVPIGVNEIFVTAYGGKGGSSAYASGGLGGFVSTSINVNAFDILFIYVGGRGLPAGSVDSGGGWNGGGNGNGNCALSSGGGGGASDVRTIRDDLSSRIVVAGGGGGGSWDLDTDNMNIDGGMGGGIGVGEEATAGFPNPKEVLSTGGGGATDSAGGVAGHYNNYVVDSAYPGVVGVGGKPAPGTCGGGGGGGYFGGGGGSFTGGGGGSSYVGSNPLIDSRAGYSGDEGYVVFSYELPASFIPTTTPTMVFPTAYSIRFRIYNIDTAIFKHYNGAMSQAMKMTFTSVLGLNPNRITHITLLNERGRHVLRVKIHVLALLDDFEFHGGPGEPGPIDTFNRVTLNAVFDGSLWTHFNNYIQLFGGHGVPKNCYLLGNVHTKKL